jgi:alpha-L-rhamnosidase
VKARYDSIHGRITSEWRTNGAGFELHTTIPPNTNATVFLPTKDAASATEGSKPLADAPGVKLLRTEQDRVVLAVESGSYHFQTRR